MMNCARWHKYDRTLRVIEKERLKCIHANQVLSVVPVPRSQKLKELHTDKPRIMEKNLSASE